jgi:hypothetical protein
LNSIYPNFDFASDTEKNENQFLASHFPQRPISLDLEIMFCLMLQQVLPPEKSFPSNPQTPGLSTGKQALIVHFTHVLRELGLGMESRSFHFLHAT